MKATIRTFDNKECGEVELADSVFAAPVRADLMARTVCWQLARARAGTHKVQTRGEVKGSKAKQFRQKGTGRARRSTSKVSQFRGGARAFGPTVRSHAHSLPKKIRIAALRSALSDKQSQGKLLIVNEASLPSPKTKNLHDRLHALGIANALCIAGDRLEQNFALAAQNLIHFDVLVTAGINVYDVLRRDYLILTQSAVAALEARLG
ncbi:MAG: 50S ribosomal protein L4 [Pseudomonadota bacterium]